MNKIFISTTSFGEYDPSPIELCKKNGYDVLRNPYGRTISPAELIKLANDVVGIIAGTEAITKDVLLRLPLLKVISRCGVGLDNIDLVAADDAGIQVFNTPHAPTQAVAELTIGLILASLRRITEADRLMRRGKWSKPMGHLLAEKTVGIIGYGRIGQAVSKLAEAFEAKVIAYDIKPSSKASMTKTASFDELIATSDIITLHVSSEKYSKECIINSDVIAKMKNRAYIINTSRGGLIDENALYDALKSGKLAGAGIDTFAEEPYTGKLAELDNVVLTPHIGSYAKEARIAMEKQAVDNLLKGLEVKI